MALQCYLRPKVQWKGSWRMWNIFSNTIENHFNRCVTLKCWYIVYISLQKDNDIDMLLTFDFSVFAGVQIKAKNSYSQKSPRKSKSPKSPAVNASQERNIRHLLKSEWVNLTYYCSAYYLPPVPLSELLFLGELQKWYRMIFSLVDEYILWSAFPVKLDALIDQTIKNFTLFRADPLVFMLCSPSTP